MVSCYYFPFNLIVAFTLVPMLYTAIDPLSYFNYPLLRDAVAT